VPWIAAAVGTLLKGPVAFVLVAVPLAVAATIAPTRPAWREVAVVRGGLVAALIVAALYVPMGLLDASYLAAFTATNLRRFGAESPHAAPAWSYLVWIPLLALPWTAVGAGALVAAARDPARRRLVLWPATIAVVLALPQGKLPTYALSAVAPLALAIGPALVRPGAGEDRTVRAGAWLLAGVVGAAAFAVPFVAGDYPVGVAGRAGLTLALLAAAGAVGWALVARRAWVPALLLAATLVLEPLAVRVVIPAVARLHSDRDTAAVVRSAEPAPVIAFAARMPSLVFYLGAPVVRTDDLAVVRDVWAQNGLAFLATGRRHFASIEGALGDRAHVWYATPRRRLYANRPRP
jgi:4-amino-4-deoxy-L-arabinose transferase-like glycosyltransferase